MSSTAKTQKYPLWTVLPPDLRNAHLNGCRTPGCRNFNVAPVVVPGVIDPNYRVERDGTDHRLRCGACGRRFSIFAVRAHVGKVYHYINGKFDFHQRVYKFSDFREVSGRYLFHYLRSLFFNVALLGTAKSTVDSLRLPLIQNFEVAFPQSREEQKRIVAHADFENRRISLAVDVKKEQIAALTGFDQPKLCAMYVDKKLQHVLAVQALSRLNRSAPNVERKLHDHLNQPHKRRSWSF